ncbi:acetoacetyl-CoA reductase [soil metagenome]
MKDKIALVTGGMGGIGTAICQSFSKEGAKVIAAYNKNGDHDIAAAWQQMQKQQGYEIDIHYVDVTDFDSCHMMVQQVNKRFGGIDILINNAGVTCDVPFRKMEFQQWKHVVDTNLDSLFNVTRNIINGMIERNYGRIINISSINGQMGQFGQTNYAASKAGIHGFTKSLAREVANKTITVNTVAPGYVATDMVMAIRADIRQQIIAQIPANRLAQPEEIARVVAFLAAEASSYITGSIISINGGLHMY